MYKGTYYDGQTSNFVHIRKEKQKRRDILICLLLNSFVESIIMNILMGIAASFIFNLLRIPLQIESYR